jgi:hypothetical protein
MASKMHGGTAIYREATDVTSQDSLRLKLQQDYTYCMYCSKIDSQPADILL